MYVTKRVQTDTALTSLIKLEPDLTNSNQLKPA